MTKVYIIRHAEAEGNLYRRVHGWYNSLITDNGYRQIAALRGRFADVHIDAVYSSDLFRTMTTATSTLLTLTTSLNILGAVIIGGSKSLWGTSFGVLIIYGIQSMFLSKIAFFQKNPAFITMITGLLIILVVMFFPGGFAQIATQVKAWCKRKFGKARKEVA